MPAKIRTILVDDEPLARASVSILLRNDPQIEIIAECSSGAEALTAIRTLKPDLLFLDVEMPELDGFDVLEMLGTHLPPAIIFVTAYDKYALRAFETGALDYLLKPFDNGRFHRALDRAKLRAVPPYDRPSPSVLTVKSAGQIHFLKLSEIDWIEAADYYSCLHIGPKTHLLRRSMAELEAELDPNLFCRIHRSAIVQIDRVKSLQINKIGEYDVLLNDNTTTLRLSRRHRKHLQSLLESRNASPTSPSR